MECLENIIGLSETACECLLPAGSDEAAELNVSRSGVFFDRLEGMNLNLVKGSEDCNNPDMWEMIAKAINDAKLDLQRDLIGCISRFHKPIFNNFAGQIGQASFKNTLTPNKTYVGMRLRPTCVKGGYIILNKVGLIVNAAASVTFHVYSNENDATLLFSSTPVSTTANQITWAVLSTPLELPMWGQERDFIQYYIVMELTGGFNPKDNKISCGCGADKSKRAWERWITVDGVTGNDVTDMSTFTQSSDNILNGIAINIDLKCLVKEVICSSEHPLDFENDGNAMNMAYAIRYKAGIKMFENILASDLINRFTLMNREHCANKIREWSEIYQRYITDTCENTTRLFDNDCLICRDGKGTVIKRSILK